MTQSAGHAKTTGTVGELIMCQVLDFTNHQIAVLGWHHQIAFQEGSVGNRLKCQAEVFTEM